MIDPQVRKDIHQLQRLDKAIPGDDILSKMNCRQIAIRYWLVAMSQATLLDAQRKTKALSLSRMHRLRLLKKKHAALQRKCKLYADWNVEPKPLPSPDRWPVIGEKWTHTNGNNYEVTGLSNLESGEQAKYPTTVHYVNIVNRKPYSRFLRDWHRSFVPYGAFCHD